MEKGENRRQGLFIKNNYYPGKLLHASDFIKEQEYGNSKLEFINRKFHGCGVIDGLEVRAEENGDLHVTAGSAIDPYGRILVVPEEVTVNAGTLEGLKEDTGRDFVLGIRYAEREVEKEHNYLKEKEAYATARIAESYALGAYSREEWEELKNTAGKREEALTEKKVLYENEEVRLTLQIPRIVPIDSIFRCRIQVQALCDRNVSIEWRGMAKLQGAFFTVSGQPFQVLEEKRTMFSGRLEKEWEICTEEERKLSVTFELSNLEIRLEGSETETAETCQMCIETAAHYEDAVRKYLWGWEKERGQGANWLPLAYVRRLNGYGTDKRALAVQQDGDVRFMAVHPMEQEVMRHAAEQNGIVDIRWRGLLKKYRHFPPPGPKRPLQPEYKPPSAPEPVPPQPGFIPKQIQELLAEAWEKRVYRGVAVIPIPRRYRRGQVLVSEEISHGFPGEEVFIWCGRVYEEHNYAYWERDKSRYYVLHGSEELFPEAWDSGWEIEKQALWQDVEAGTFQIALTLSKGHRKNRSREVAISWIAVRTI